MDEQTDRQMDGQMDRQTRSQTDVQINRQTGIHMDRKTEIHMDRHTDTEIHRQTRSQTNIKINRQTDIHMNRRTYLIQQMDSKALSLPHTISFKFIPMLPSPTFCEAALSLISLDTCSMRNSLLENWQIFLSSDFLRIDITSASFFAPISFILSPVHYTKVN